eukprot:10289042-Ditylum_brightwellii.AAC.1
MPVPEKGEKIITKIRGLLVDILFELCPGVYNEYVVHDGKSKVLCVCMLMALYGILILLLLFYKKFRTDIESIGFEINPYNVCVANRMVNGKQHMVTWHVNDVKSSHVNPKVNNEFHHWCKNNYGCEHLGHVKVVRGETHNYLAMALDYTQPGAFKINMKDYIKGILEDFPYKTKKQQKHHRTRSCSK